MNDIAGRVLDYLGYKNKVRIADWTERLWQQHLQGTPEDIRLEEDHQRWARLLTSAEQRRSLARTLHQRRTAHAPFAGVQLDSTFG